MKKLLVGFIMDGKSGGIDKYLLNFLTKVSNEEVRIDFLTNEIDVELQTELKKFHSNLYAIANLKHPVSQYRQVCRIMKETIIKENESGQRLDKYLKVSRLIKRRTVANEACDSGRVLINDKPAKASANVKEGDIISISFGNKEVKVEVLDVQETVKKEEAKELFRYI